MNHASDANRKTVLVLGDYRQSVVAVRSLARAGYRVTLGTTDSSSSTALSRHVSALWLYAHETDEHFHTQLESYLTAEKPALVFVVGETQLRSLARAAPRFDALSRWAAPPWHTIMTCFDKHAMNCIARGLGIPTPEWRLFSDSRPLLEQADAIGYPVVVKRRDSSALIRGKKAVILGHRAGLSAFLAGLDAEADAASLMLQKFAPGPRHNCHFGAVAGKLVFYFEQKVLRTDEPDDTGVGIEGLSVAPSALLMRYCAALAEALRYDGIGCVQFLVDAASGATAFLELNARMDSTAALPYRLGYDFPRLAADIANDGAAVAARPPPPAYRSGARYHWLFGDTLSWLAEWRRREKSRPALAAWLLRSALTAATSHHLTWEASDPLPTLHQYAGLLRRFVLKRFSSARRMDALRNVDDWRIAASKRLPRIVWDYLEGGAEDGLTLQDNRRGFADIGLLPRALVDVSARSTATTVFGRRYAMPLGIAPLGAACLLRAAADVHMCRAACRSNVPFVLSTHSFVPVTRVAWEGGMAPWFQLYLSNDRSAGERAVRTAAEAGSDVLVLTTDVPVGGNREYNERNGFGVPFRLGPRHVLDGLLHPRWALDVVPGLRRHGGTPAHFVGWGARRDAVGWAEVAWLRQAWSGKLVIKGILTVEDALRALDYGADGIYISNHGGRQLDGAPAAVRVLADVAAAVRGRAAVFLDGGVRRGSDIAKTLALGADMVFIGRAAAYGVAVAGETGVATVVQTLGKELDRVMALLGCCSPSELAGGFIHRAPSCASRR